MMGFELTKQLIAAQRREEDLTMEFALVEKKLSAVTKVLRQAYAMLCNIEMNRYGEGGLEHPLLKKIKKILDEGSRSSDGKQRRKRIR